uniref:SWIM-type domain-containing protein n=2 Tax=Clastoptera arizonana TaxID=38151 RepID=A0A1B6CIJ5_9HEMI
MDTVMRHSMELMPGGLPLDWDDSFEDSDRFEEDSLCSWITEPESICNNWRGWKKPLVGSPSMYGSSKKFFEDNSSRVTALSELAARCVASHIPFELVEHVYPPVPEQLQLRIAFWSFPDNEEDIRLYSCLANSSAEEFQRGEHLFRSRAVKDPLQIGFHLSASVLATLSTYNVAVTFDRRRITSCNCTCNSSAYWCSHIVAVCLHRIHMPNQVTLRAPVSESLSRLQRDQLQKFAQYLISELPQQILPTAQRLLDELLSTQPSAINSVCGAPDPTAGASANEQTSWYLDEKTLHDNIKKILIKFCVPAPIVFSDVNYLTTTAPPAAAEWTSLLRPLRGREPEGMWNLLSIVKEMFKRNDRNALPLLEIITEESMACEQIIVWWFYTKVQLHNGYGGGGMGGGGGKHGNVNSNSHASQHACSSLCDEIVILWRLAALNPGIAPDERKILKQQFKDWHIKIVEKVGKCRGFDVTYSKFGQGTNKMSGLEVFSGFKPAIEACFLNWDDYQLPGITYNMSASWLYHTQPFTCFRHMGESTKHDYTTINPVNASQVVLNPDFHTRAPLHHYHHHNPHLQHSTSGKNNRPLRSNSTRDSRQLFDHFSLLSFMSRQKQNSNCNENFHISMPSTSQVVSTQGHTGNRSSVSSEGFCENEPDTDLLAMPSQPLPRALDQEETDSQGGGGSDSSWGSKRDENVQIPTKSSPISSGDERDSPVPIAPLLVTQTRRLSKDDSLSSSNSDWQPSGDEYHVYYYDPKALNNNANEDRENRDNKESSSENFSEAILNNLQGLQDPWDILFARAEGLHAHGHTREACILGVKLAEEMLANPPNLMIELPPVQSKGKRKKVNPASHQLSVIASNTLAKCAFLCTVLAENPEYFHLAFKVGLFGLEMARPPASTKPLEVKLANQESDLVVLLKRIPLGEQELTMIRERAHQLKNNSLKSRGEALLPINLAGFILDSLLMSAVGRDSRSQVISPSLILATDETLGFEAAVAALGLKANVSEADHPLLCEGTRRQRGDLAITLLVLYKDDPCKLAHIMDKLLDREIHQLIKNPVPSSYYSSNPPINVQFGNRTIVRNDLEPTGISTIPQSDVVMDLSMISNNGSRPHSCTSAEYEQGIGLPINSPSSTSVGTNNVLITSSTPTRPKETTSRFKHKRPYPSIPNQPSEAGAHFTFELAKTVLAKAGGNTSTYIFTQASTSQNHHGPHRALHMCAFQLGLYALGLHNVVSLNWLSRTYSSHVSWITGQAMDIGAPAISFLMDTWEGHLTPSEAVSIADRASRGCDANMVAAAAQLALSCLPHAHALNPNEIQRAILQCKEQSDQMLEHSCLTVESAAKGGGVYPEVLFQVAKYWFELYMRHPSNGDQSFENESFEEINQEMPIPEPHPSTTQPPITPVLHQPPPPPYHTQPLAHSYTIPFGFTLQHLPPQFQITARHHPHLSIPPAQVYHLSSPTFQYPPHAANSHPPYANLTPVSQPPTLQYYGVRSHAFTIASMQPVIQNQLVLAQPSSNQCVTQAISSPQQLTLSRPQQQTAHRQQQMYDQIQLRYLLAAYRVGMLALETLSRRVHDDRPQAKYARNPPYGEDVKWLLRIAKKLGSQYLHQLCVCAVNSIVSPFVLHDMALEAAHYLSPEGHYRNNPGLVMQHLRCSALTPLVQKCQQMYIQCLHQKLYHLTTSDYEEFVTIVCSARAAFSITPEGSSQFKEWLQSIRRSKSCKKDLWAQINSALQAK